MTLRRKRTPANLYVGGPYDPLTFWEAYRVPLCMLVLVLVSLVVVLLMGGRV